MLGTVPGLWNTEVLSFYRRIHLMTDITFGNYTQVGYTEHLTAYEVKVFIKRLYLLLTTS